MPHYHPQNTPTGDSQPARQESDCKKQSFEEWYPQKQVRSLSCDDSNIVESKALKDVHKMLEILESVGPLDRPVIEARNFKLVSSNTPCSDSR